MQTVSAVGFGPDDQVVGGARPTAIEPDGDRPAEREVDRRGRAQGDARVGHVGARGEPAPGLPAVAEAQIDDVEDVEATVVGVTSGRDVPRAQVLSVHGHQHLATPPRPPGHQVAEEGPLDAVQHDEADVDRVLPDLLPQVIDGCATAEGAAEIAPAKAEHGSGPTAASRRVDQRRAGGVIGHLDQVYRSGARRPQSSRRRTVTTAAEPPGHRRRGRRPLRSPTRRRRWPWTPRRHHGTGGRPPLARVARVSSTGASRASWRSRSMSCFMLRTKSPPDSSSSSTTSAKRCPAAQACARATNVGSGGRGHGAGRPPPPRGAARRRATRWPPTACGRSRDGNHGAGGASGLRCS